MDNNVVASSNFKEIISEIIDLGFERGAKLKRGRHSSLRRWLQSRRGCAHPLQRPHVSKGTEPHCHKTAAHSIRSLGCKKPYSQAIRYAADAGIYDLSNYMLYNFRDSPEDLFERMRLNVSLNEELGIRIFSFPMRYQPVTRPDRGHVGDKWNSYYLRSVQIVLRATHGVVSGAPAFFKTAFGDTYQDFERIISRPHHFIFNRYWYDRFGGKPKLEDFDNHFSSLTADERTELLNFLNDNVNNQYEQNLSSLPIGKLRDTASFYIPLTKEREQEIWKVQKELRDADLEAYIVPDDELVEDAGLEMSDLNRQREQHSASLMAAE